MKKYLLLFIIHLVAARCSAQGIVVNTGPASPDPSAMLDVKSTDQGLLLPRLTAAQRNAITNPTAGLMIFNTDTQSMEVYSGGSWFAVSKTKFSVEKLLGGAGQDESRQIQRTTDGGYIVAGYSTSSANGNIRVLNHGMYDYWIVKLTQAGNISWSKLLGGSKDDKATSVQQTTDGGYIVAGYSASSATGDIAATNHGLNDCWIVKLDASGNIIWNKLLGGTGQDQAYSIQQTADGGYIIAGSTTSSLNGDVWGNNHGGSDYWIVKLNGDGNVLWNTSLGGNANEQASSICQTADGGYIVAGQSFSSATGNVTAVNHGDNDYWIIKLDASGTIVWNKLLGGNNGESANAVQQTIDGGYIIAGHSISSNNGNVTATSNGSYDYWVVKLDAAGNISWNKLLGGIGQDEAYTIVQTTDGGFVVAGYASSSATGSVSELNHGSFDCWITKLNASGNIVWEKLLGGSSNDYAYSVQRTTDGGYIVAGVTASSADGDISKTNHGGFDYWIIKLDGAGNVMYQ